jgi:hypothetical protein
MSLIRDLRATHGILGTSLFHMSIRTDPMKMARKSFVATRGETWGIPMGWIPALHPAHNRANI